MNTLLIALFLALVATAQAQTTNFTAVRVTVVTNGVTDQITINLSARESDGFLLNYAVQAQAAQQATNPPPTLQNATKQTVNTMLLNPLAEQARAQERQTNKVDIFIANIASYWEGLTGPQKQAIKDVANAVVTP